MKIAGGELGAPAPEFVLPDTRGELHALHEPAGASATVLVWTCNHCPYALAWHGRIADVARDYAGRGVRVLAVNSNDPVRYPADSLDAMRKRVDEEDWSFPYLHDESQEAARAVDAQVTPHVFVYDAGMRLAYSGAPDADHGDPAQNAEWLRDALDAVLAGEDPSRAQTEAEGCSIKWRG
jgi:peroxiredoxin